MQKPYISNVDGMWVVLDSRGQERYSSSSLTDAQKYLNENWSTL